MQLTLTQALELAEKRNPDLLVSNQGIAVSRSGVTIAGQRPNPTLGVGVPIGPAERKQSVVFNVPLELGGRRDARLAVAEAVVKEATLNQSQALLVTLNQTRNAFVELALAHAGLEQSQRDVEFYDRLIDASKRKFDSGDVAEAEVIRAVFEREQIKRALYPAENRVEGALLALNRLLGQPLDTPIQPVDEGWLFPTERSIKGPTWQLPDLPALKELARARRPDVALFTQQMETMGHRVELARANQSPDFSLQGSLLYNPVIPAFTYLVGLQMELPWGSDRGGEVEQAQARQQEALLRQQATFATADHAVVLAWTNFQAARRQMIHDLETLKPQSERVLFLAEKIYQLGQGDITEVLLAGQSVQRLRQLLLQDVARLHQTLGELELAVNAKLLGGNQ